MGRVLLAIAVLAVVALAYFVVRRTRDGRAAPLTARVGTLDADRQTLRALREAGADLSKETEVSFYLYFPTQAAADSAAARATTPGLPARVTRAADGSAWLCLISGRIVPSESAIRAASTRLREVAAAYNGEYDGWEAAVTR